MAVTLEDNRLIICLVRFSVRHQTADPTPQSHRAAFVRHLALIEHQIDNGIGRLLIEFGAIGVFKAKDITGEFDDRHLHAQAEPKVGNILAAGEISSLDFASDTTMAKATG